MSLHILTIVGPTASGKTRLGVEIAHHLGSEIISADSRQVYRGLDIGTGKDLCEYASVSPPVAYHLIDIADPEEVYTLFRYQQDCYEVLRTMESREPFAETAVPAVMVGGSGLYVEAVVRGYRLADVPKNGELRTHLEKKNRDDLVAELKRRSPELAEKTDLSSKRRVIRSIEVVEFEENAPVRYSEPPGIDLGFSVYGVRVERDELRRRIGERLRSRLEEGMVEEVQGLLDRGITQSRLEELGLEYREIGTYLAGQKTRVRMVADLEAAIGRFAKRQLTWFRGMERRGTPIRWIGPKDIQAVIEELA
ncbi:MAG: tRNA (adenosine(37)-N6)-dimethylallyltransferase MiaA [Acidobacteria bacterium]|jgi:tRNA dimethylallyltransferase|nr:tRNA (adenosine(37)-N6)-dimethylallyltransferase MiaA [Acidobacteriota bacterium]